MALTMAGTTAKYAGGESPAPAAQAPGFLEILQLQTPRLYRMQIAHAICQGHAMRSKTQEAISEIVNPIRRNTLQERRVRLGLSRPALARILDVDPASIFRHERKPMTALWDYALRAVEAEAADQASRQVLRYFTPNLSHQNFIPEQIDARGHKYVAEKMNQARRQSVRKTKPQGRKPRRVQNADPVQAAVQRAIDRSEAQRKKSAQPGRSSTRANDRNSPR